MYCLTSILFSLNYFHIHIWAALILFLCINTTVTYWNAVCKHTNSYSSSCSTSSNLIKQHFVNHRWVLPSIVSIVYFTGIKITFSFLSYSSEKMKQLSCFAKTTSPLFLLNIQHNILSSSQSCKLKKAS